MFAYVCLLTFEQIQSWDEDIEGPVDLGIDSDGETPRSYISCVSEVRFFPSPPPPLFSFWGFYNLKKLLYFTTKKLTPTYRLCDHHAAALNCATFTTALYLFCFN